MRVLRRITLALLCLALPCQSVVAQRGGAKDVVAGQTGTKLDEQMTALAGTGFSGVLFVARNGQVLISKGYGTANRERNIPFTAETVFDIGSLTKQFTGAAILKLEMQGKLRVTDLISKYLADVPPDKAAITIHHLLTHSAGFADALGSDYQPISRDEFIKLAFASKLQSVPGEQHHYSNVGYSLLGAIIEVVTKKSYERYLHDNLFAPAGMRKTGYRIPEWKPDEVAVGYRRDGKAWGTPLDKAWAADGPFWHLRANGGILSTVGDLYKWHLALEGERVLSRQAKEKYFAPHIAEQPGGNSSYGYGWVTQKTRRGTRLIWHNGGNPVFYAEVRRYVDEGVVFIIASTVAGHSAGQEIPKLMPVIFGAAPRT